MVVCVNDQCRCTMACHNTTDAQAINLLTFWGQFDRGLILSVTEWNLFIIPNVMVSSLRAFFSSLSIFISLSLEFTSFLICSLVQFGNILLISFTYILPFRSRSSLIPHSCLVLLLSMLSWSSGLHYSPSIFHFSSLHLLLSLLLIFSHTLSQLFIHSPPHFLLLCSSILYSICNI